MGRAAAHLRYVQRDGVTREGERGQLYGPEQDQTGGKDFLDRSQGDRHQFRFIVAPEDGSEYSDFKPFTRRLMTQMEKDLNTRLDWVAVDHFNTGHPHIHITLRGKDETGHDLVLAKNYLTVGIRERAAGLVSLDLGPRSEVEIEAQLRADMTAERLTGFDKQLRGMEDDQGLVSPHVKEASRQSLLTGRLRHLERFGLAEEQRPGLWQLKDGMEDALRVMGERGDIIKTLHREMSGKGIARSPADYIIHDPSMPREESVPRPITGRVVARGLSDELGDNHYLIVDGMDGRAHYVDIGVGELTEPTPVSSLVRLTPKSIAARAADHTITEVAATNGGCYNVDLHLKHDPRATADFAETHVRRLEAIRRTTEGIARTPDGTWIIAPDYLDRAVEHECVLAKRTPFVMEKLSALPLDRQVGADGATWLDREIVSISPEATRDSGFGRDVRDAMRRRQQWLIEQGLAQEQQGQFIARSNLLAVLQRRELHRVAGQLSSELGLAYAEPIPGIPVSGTLRSTVNLASGKFAVIENSREFTLVPWRPVLERHIGQHVSGIMRDNGISWTIGRGRGLGI